MPHPRISSDAIADTGQELYERRLQSQLETKENLGKILSVDVETGDYALGDDPVETSRRLLAKHPGAAIWTCRIGYNAVYAVGGTRTRTSA